MSTAGRRGYRLARFASRISIRLLAFNVLLVFLPAAGLLYLGTYERQLLDAQERSMVQQGRLLAAALSGREGLEGGEAQRVLVELDRRQEARLRVVDPDGRVIADSASLGPRRQAAGETAPAAAAAPAPPAAGERPRTSPLYRLGTLLHRLYRSVQPAPELPPARLGLYTAEGPGASLSGPAVREALAGRYGADLRVTATEEGSVTTLYSAIPVLGPSSAEGDGGATPRGRPVLGAVLVSQSTARILQALSAVRLGIFRVFLASVAAAIVLSLLVSTTIARPIGRLRDEARAIVDRRGRLTGGFGGSRKLDEIGDLARALEALTRRLRHYLGATEAFAADVSHEFKNPLASIRSAAEMLAVADDPADRRRFEEIVLREVARLEHLLSGVREITAIDALADREPQRPLDLAELLRSLVEGYRQRGRRTRLELTVREQPLPVRGNPDRLSQAIENLLDNAVGFTPEGATVEVELAARDGHALLSVADRGPGVPAEHRERIFDRFFTYRPQRGTADATAPTESHTGLGLAIARAVVEAHGGTLRAAERTGGGARFEIGLPLAGRPQPPGRGGAGARGEGA